MILKIFIAGPRAIKELDENICEKLNNICEKKYNILVGDAEGVDSSIQKFLQIKLYRNVTVFASKGTFNNMVNLLNLGKEVILYYAPNQKFYQFKTMKDLSDFLNTNVKLDSKLKKLLPKKDVKQFVQTCLL